MPMLTTKREPAHRSLTPATHAERTLCGLLVIYFGSRYVDGTGSMMYACIERDMRRTGFGSAEMHAQDCFQDYAVKLFQWLDDHPEEAQEIENLEAWLHRIRRNDTVDYLKRLARAENALNDPKTQHTLHAILEGEQSVQADRRELLDDAHLELLDDAHLELLITSATVRLAPRHQEFIKLEFGTDLDREEIQRKMGIKSKGYFKKLACCALKSLREALQEIVTTFMQSWL